jgi:hypothetical protein
MNEWKWAWVIGAIAGAVVMWVWSESGKAGRSSESGRSEEKKDAGAVAQD